VENTLTWRQRIVQDVGLACNGWRGCDEGCLVNQMGYALTEVDRGPSAVAPGALRPRHTIMTEAERNPEESVRMIEVDVEHSKLRVGSG
jgi:hypothetical protein